MKDGTFGYRAYTGAAWLSSARVVRCWVKSRNERNPYAELPAREGGDSQWTAGDKPEDGGDDVKSSWPSCPGRHTCYNGRHKGKPRRETERILVKVGPSSDRGLQPDRVKPESLVIADQPSRGEYVPGPCTHRPSHHPSWGHPKPPAEPARGGGVEGASGKEGEVVTR